MADSKTYGQQAVLVYDGQAWFLFCRCGSGMRLCAEQAGAAGRIPDEMLRGAAAGGVKRVRFLLAGDIRRLEIALPTSLRFDDANALLANEIADLSGAYGGDLLCAGTSADAFGVKPGSVLTGCFERAQMQALQEQVVGAKLAFDGVAALELACLAYWRMTHGDRAETLLLIGPAHVFIAPSRQLPESPGPISVSGGIRHITSDPDGWSTRFQRGTRFLEKADAVHLLAMAAPQEGIESIVCEKVSLPSAQHVEREILYVGAALVAATARANNLKSAVPVANPYVPRKRFSHAWIVLPCLLILALPLLGRACQDQRLKIATKRYNKEAAQYLPLEKTVKDAEKKRKETQERYQRELVSQRQLGERRKPLAAFIHMAYFFSKHAGDTVLLEFISSGNGSILTQCFYTDPEDGLALNKKLKAFTDSKGLRITTTDLDGGLDSEGNALQRMKISVDYANVKTGR